MAYIVKLGGIRLPIPPSKITWKDKSGNKTVTLINEGEVNILKDPKLTTIDFDVILPMVPYPFAYSEANDAYYYIDKINGFKASKKPVMFVVDRKFPNGTSIHKSSLKVSVEDTSIEENSENGFDLKFSISLKKYASYGAKRVTVKNNKVKKKKVKKTKNQKVKKGKGVDFNSPKITIEYVIKKPCNTLMLIAKKFYNETGASYQKKIYNANKKVIEAVAKKHKRKSSANGKYLYEGTKLQIPLD